MTVSLVFGASGAIGRFLVPRLLAAGHEVIAVSRVSRTSNMPNLRWIAGDLPGRVPSLPRTDHIFSLGPLDAFARWFADNGEARARVVAIGSLSAETKQQSADSHERELAARLVRAEELLAAAADARGCTSTVLRASLIYGAGLDKSLTPFVRFAQRWRVFPLLLGARGLRQPVHADDLAGACIAASAAPTLAARMYEVGGGERIRFDAMLARVRSSLPFGTIPMPVPYALARACAGFAQRSQTFAAASPAALQRMNDDLVVDNTATASDFGWSPRDFRPRAEDWTPPPLP
jgi:nucleoside-diphosphate-sugar epimerase